MTPSHLRRQGRDSLEPGRPGGAAGDTSVRWPLLGLLLPLAVLALSALEPPQRLLLVTTEEQPARSEMFTLRDGWLGSPRIALEAELPDNSTVELGVRLLDATGRPVLELFKDGWRESGVWVEGGESGSWQERDTALQLQLRPQASGRFQLEVTLDELLGVSGLPLQAPVTLRGTVRNHSVDAGLLLFTAVVSQAIVLCLLAAVYGAARSRRLLRVEEGVAAVRLPLGGPGLLKLVVRARWELPDGATPELPPLALAPFSLSLSDATGERRLDHQATLAVVKHANDGDHWLTLTQTHHLRLPVPGSYRLRVTVPEAFGPQDDPWEIEWLQLSVEDGVKTAFRVPLLPLRPRGAPA
ncbi:hypothetical protein KQ313_03155 [Synechococcus sp. CS-1325]|uniref:hypothetical protein n=1 Tax=Synechococcus sp. CS-1325 TaxID=2847979 RepID=UPI00223B1F92|nr:hypothetical protein [Synechococcus sp. CS-1325]MCT0198683.1 hypothetical protein [Synechococcus sp. CS-1325]